MSAITLTQGAIAAIFSGSATENDVKPVLQVVDLRPVNAQNLSADQCQMLLSDGEFFQLALPGNNLNGLIIPEQLQKGSIVQLLHFVCNYIQDRKVIIIIAMNVILTSCNPIGQPKKYPVQKNGNASAAAVTGGNPLLCHQQPMVLFPVQPSYGLSFPGNFNTGTCPKVEVGSATPGAPLINYEQSVSAARKEVFGIVDQIGGFTLPQKLMVSKTLVNNTDELELFSSLPTIARAEYARMMLAGEL